MSLPLGGKYVGDVICLVGCWSRFVWWVVYALGMLGIEFVQGGNHRVRVIPLNWVHRGAGMVTITKAMAHCENCGWDTPILFHIDRARAAAERHVVDKTQNLSKGE